MATKKQKRAAVLAKREEFLANERERCAKALEKSRLKRKAEAETAKRKVEHRDRRDRAKSVAAQLTAATTLPS